MDMITLAMAKPKKIDLTKYALEGYGASGTFNSAILLAFENGGRHIAVTDNSNFWADVNTDRPLKFVIDTSEFIQGGAIECPANSVTFVGGVPFAIECSFLVNTGAWYRVTVMFGYVTDGITTTTTITVVVDPLTIPGA